MCSIGVMTVYPQVAQAKQERAVNRYNQQLLEWQGRDALVRGEREAWAIHRLGERVKGAQRVGFAQSGVVIDADTPLDVVVGTAGNVALDMATARNNAARESWFFRTQSEALHAENKNRIGNTALSVLGASLATAGSMFGGGSGFQMREPSGATITGLSGKTWDGGAWTGEDTPGWAAGYV